MIHQLFESRAETHPCRVALLAKMVSELRKTPLFGELSVLDVYGHPTIESLAAEMEQRRPDDGFLPLPRLGAALERVCLGHIEAGAALGDLSLLMKGEMLPAGTAWEGIPARPA